MIKFVVIPDLHGDQADPETVSVMRQYIRDYKPNARVMIGDIFDFRNLRRGASEEERSDSMREDVMAGKALIDIFRPTHVTLGNHDQRLWDEARNGKGLIQEYCQRGVDDIKAQFRKHKTEWCEYSIHEGIEIGAAYFIHGFRANIHSAKSTAEDHAKPGRSIFYGHTHSTSVYKSVGGTKAYNIGCACNLDMEYSRRRPNTLRHEHAFAAGEIYDDHVIAWFCKPDKNGVWRLTSGVKSYVGR